MERRLKEMVWLMPIDSNDVHMIRIYGIDGIGKTILAKVVYNEIVHQFDGASLLLNISSREKGLFQLQKQLLKDILGGDIPTISDISEGSYEIRCMFMSKKVLVVLDDVDSDEQLNCLFPNHNAFGLGSRIIVTSRDKYLLVRCQVDALYGVKELNCNEAIQLFSLRAFHMNSPQKGFINLSSCIVDYCKGLPLAFEVLSSFLFGRKKIEWKSVLQSLEKEPFLKIQHVLVRGFETLGMLEREIFFNGEDLDFVQRILDACHSFAKLRMQELDDKSLISILDKKLSMHDLMQKAGWEIVRRQNHNEPGKWSRLWDPEDVHHVLIKNTVRA